jgi:hypothetical protein
MESGQMSQPDKTVRQKNRGHPAPREELDGLFFLSNQLQIFLIQALGGASHPPPQRSWPPSDSEGCSGQLLYGFKLCFLSFSVKKGDNIGILHV